MASHYFFLLNAFFMVVYKHTSLVCPSIPSFRRIPLYFYFILQWGVYVMQLLSVRTFFSYTDINFRSFPRSFPHAMCDAMGGFTSTLLFGLQFVKRG
ncbi:hypothetical protein K457DRAFT_318100 [Linnemannia elongata AG-77]|uniref:Uncharacterized protein n=1 Tax=Linnemannia elongata AG-77 TaxID=1314771 RepID=A0A197K6M6_9FUNG|nr:hypothetical protein K457DRAFT_318100 [Linnemannia elongata AG-77]